MLYEVRCEIHNGQDSNARQDTAMVLCVKQYVHLESAIEAARQYVRGFGPMRLVEAMREGWTEAWGSPRAYVGEFDEAGFRDFWVTWTDDNGTLQECAYRQARAGTS
jgi:hypothetical protein